MFPFKIKYFNVNVYSYNLANIIVFLLNFWRGCC